MDDATRDKEKALVFVREKEEHRNECEEAYAAAAAARRGIHSKLQAIQDRDHLVASVYKSITPMAVEEIINKVRT